MTGNRRGSASAGDASDVSGSASGRVGVGIDVGRRQVRVSARSAGEGPGVAALREDVVLAINPSDGFTGSPIRSVQQALAQLAGRLSRSDAVPDAVAVAVAQPVRASSGAAAEPEPELRQAVADVLGIGDLLQLDPLLCVAAAEEPVAPDGTRIVCHVGAEGPTGAVCVRDGDGVRLLDGEPVPGRGAATLSDFRTALEAAALRAVERAGRRLDAAAVRAAVGRELQAHDVRAELVLDRLRHDDGYAGTPVLFIDPPQPTGEHGVAGAVITAAALAELLQPVVRAVLDLVAGLVDRSMEPVADPGVLLSGDFSGLAALRSLVAAQLSANLGDVRNLGPSAEATGAAMIAAGAVSAQLVYPYDVRLPCRRMRNGLLEDVSAALATAGRPPPGVVRGERGPLTVRVDPDDPGPIELEVRAETGPWRRVRLAAPRPPLSGTYRLALQLGRSPMGLISFLPVDGGPPVVLPLAEPGTAATEVSGGS